MDCKSMKKLHFCLARPNSGKVFFTAKNAKGAKNSILIYPRMDADNSIHFKHDDHNELRDWIASCPGQPTPP